MDPKESGGFKLNMANPTRGNQFTYTNHIQQFNVEIKSKNFDKQEAGKVGVHMLANSAAKKCHLVT